MREKRQAEQTPAEWSNWDKTLAAIAIILGLAIVVIAVCGYVFGWSWTGIVEDAAFTKRTFWDWLQLLIIPSVLALGGYLFTRSENRRAQQIAERQRAADQDIADQRAETDREIADASRQDDTLQAYLDQMGQLMLDKEPSLRQSEEDDEIRSLARAWTLTVLTRLGRGRRKRSVLQFLYEADLITKDQAVVNLRGADLRGAELHGAILSEADLRGVDLRGEETTLEFAKLIEADLREATLREANLLATDLSGADLREANLSGIKGITNEALEQQAKSLKGATMPDGQKYEDWLKSKGRGGDGEDSSH